MGVSPLNTRILTIAFALVLAPVLAGCATNETTPTPSTTTPTGTMTPTTTATPTGTTPVVPTNALPIVPPVTLKIGLLNPLSGDLANLGPSMQRGMELAVEDVNAASAVTG